MKQKIRLKVYLQHVKNEQNEKIFRKFVLSRSYTCKIKQKSKTVIVRFVQNIL